MERPGPLVMSSIKKFSMTLSILISAFSFAEKISGTYTVPVEDSNLESSNSYEINYNLKYDQDNKLQRIKYQIPRTLTGLKNKIILTPLPGSTTQWTDENSYAHCIEAETEFMCEVRYQNLESDAELAEEKIQNAFANDLDEINRRRQVMNRFLSEPAGVLHIPMEE